MAGAIGRGRSPHSPTSAPVIGIGAGAALSVAGSAPASGSISSVNGKRQVAQRGLQVLALRWPCAPELGDGHAQLAASLAVELDAGARRAVDELAGQAQLDRQGEQVERAGDAHRHCRQARCGASPR